MSATVPDDPPICHITHIRNLPAILQEGGLWCDAQAAERNLCQQSIAHDHIKNRRARKRVPVCQNGFLCDYVPFYFWHHSPMLYAIHKNEIKEYMDGQDGVIYLISSANRIRRAGLPFCFTDGHAVIALTRFFEDAVDFDRLDWEVIKAVQWADTDSDGDRKRRKQAEFLVHNFLPWDCISQIGVKNETMEQQVRDLLPAQAPPLALRASWYY